MKTVLSVTAALMLALSLGGQPNPAYADTKKPASSTPQPAFGQPNPVNAGTNKFNPGPITSVPISANPDLAIGSVLAFRCLCTPDLDRVDALYMDTIKVEVFNNTTRPFNGTNTPITIRATFHDLVSGTVKTLEKTWGGSIPSYGKVKLLASTDVHLVKRSVGITASVSVPNDTNPSNNSVTIRTCATYVIE
ncbi:MAG: hypothetical protein AABZ10_06180 [Nitrospirota bacterium]